MGVIDLIAPIAVAFIGLIGLIIYVLGITVSQLGKQVNSTNERLMIMLAAKQGEGALRGLISLNKMPKKALKGVSGITGQDKGKETGKKQPKAGFMMGTGL